VVVRRRFFLVASELRVLQCVETACLVPTLASRRRPPEAKPAKSFAVTVLNEAASRAEALLSGAR
jgi:hypothetical protein